MNLQTFHLMYFKTCNFFSKLRTIISPSQSASKANDIITFWQIEKTAFSTKAEGRQGSEFLQAENKVDSGSMILTQKNPTGISSLLTIEKAH